MKHMVEAFSELIRRASTDLPLDVTRRLQAALGDEKTGSNAHSALGLILENIVLARKGSAPVCQDTGTNTWWVYVPERTRTEEIRKAILQATVIATKKCWLRPNAVDSVTGRNSGNNLGEGLPVIHFRIWKKKGIRADLMLKGGGCENVGSQYVLPNVRRRAGRDTGGVRTVVLEAVHRAQGRGCSPGIIGVAIGGDRATGFAAAKEQLLRPLGDRNPDPTLAALEASVLAGANRLGVGPMGFGGRTTLIGVKMTKLHRIPASFFVTIAYSCWACRRASVTISGRKARFSQVAEMATKYR